MTEEQVVVPFNLLNGKVPALTAVRGAVIASSLKALRTRGLMERYFALLDPAYGDRMRAMIASTWLPLDVAVAHYHACDALALDRETAEDIGRDAGRFANQNVLSTLVKLGKEMGVTPWTALARTNQIMARSWQGSTCGVFKLGPKEARFEWIGQTLAVIPYIRVGFAGFTQGLLSLFAKRVFVRELPQYCSSTTLGYRCSWV